MTKVCDTRKAAIEALRELSENGKGVRQDHLIETLERSVKSPCGVLDFMHLLKDEDVVYVDTRPGLPDGQPTWQLNTADVSVIALDPDSFLARFALVLDHTLVRTGYPFLCPLYGDEVDYSNVSLPNAKKLGEEVFVLQVHPTVETKDLGDIVRAVEKVLEVYSA